MADLLDGDFELDGFLLGGNTGYPIYVAAFNPAGAAVLNQDIQSPTGDSIFFGSDQLAPPLWTLDLQMGEFNPQDAMLHYGSLSRVWRANRKPGQVSKLRYAIAGRTRFVYGRPRLITPNPYWAVGVGLMLARADFQTQDTLHYDDEARTLTVYAAPEASGGFDVPFDAPIALSGTGTRQGIIEGGGDAPAPFELTIHGPILNPVVRSSDWNIGLNGTVNAGQSVTVNTLTYEVTSSSGANVSGMLSRSTDMDAARLDPGASEVIFEGQDATGTAKCVVDWHPANHGL